MTMTNFSKLTDEQLTVWKRDLWREARNLSFIDQFVGEGPNSMIQRVTELRNDEKGARAVITLLADLEGDGVAGDRTLEGNEEAMKSHDQVIRMDQLRHANRHEGRMADQKSVVEFRNNSRDVLAYWLADRMDQMAFLTLSGVDYDKRNDGRDRIGSDLPFLEFAQDVAAPTDERRVRWNGQNERLEFGADAATSEVTPDDRITWESLVQLKAFARENYIRGVRVPGGRELFHVFLSPTAMSWLKLDPTYMANVRDALQSSRDNPLFTGDGVEVDGLVIHDFRHVFNTRRAPNGEKWGGAGDVDGCQVLFCGAQCLGMADIGDPTWEEKGFDYENSQGISTGKIFGLKKPQFESIYAGNTKQDFNVLSMYVAQ